MHDLIGAYERVNRVYRMYIESAFPLRYGALVGERRNLLRKNAILSQPPLVETVPVYRSSRRGAEIRHAREASLDLPAEYRDLEFLGNRLMDGNPLYEHQWESLRHAVDGKDVVVTTGTGSGKTECFLLPLLAQLIKESRSWPACPPPPAGRKWWDGASRTGQWAHTERPHALRSIILYPLNALVEDQLRRLRKTIDGQAAHGWLDQNRGGNRFLFGRYTGQTPVSGREFLPDGKVNKTAVDRLRRRLKDAQEEWDDVWGEVQKGNLEEEVLYYFANIDGAEMWSRWDMQRTPPDVMITNYSMLNIMLMRGLEIPVFEETRAWLEKTPGAKFQLIVDELHAYRGTPGTEVAYILRLLYQRLGLDKRPDQLQILTTSASVEANDKSRRFLEEFFGRGGFEIVAGRQPEPRVGAAAALKSNASRVAFERFAKAVQPDIDKETRPPDPRTARPAMAELATALGRNPREGEEAEASLGEALQQINLSEALRDAVAQVNPVAEPKPGQAARSPRYTSTKAGPLPIRRRAAR